MSPIAAILAILLAKDVPTESSAHPYVGPAIAVSVLEEANDLDDASTTRQAAQLLLAIAQSRRFRLELVARGAVELLVAQLASSGDAATRVFAMQTLVHLALEPRAHARLHESDAVVALLTHLQRPVCDQLEAEEVLRVLHCLLTSPAIRARFVELDGISKMADLVFAGSAVQKERAAFVLWMLAAIPCLQSTFPSTKAIHALVHALEDGHGASDLTDVALSALALLAESGPCRAALIAEGVVELLPRVVESDDREEVAYRTELLEELLAVSQRV